MNKFKVWCKNNKEWEQHSVLMDENGILFHIKPGGALLPLRPDTHIPVFFTGLPDKDGKEIYEGDIVRYHDNKEFTVPIILEPKLGTGHYFHRPCCSYYSLNESTIRDYEVEVIGNIHDNPELIESGVKA